MPELTDLECLNDPGCKQFVQDNLHTKVSDGKVGAANLSFDEVLAFVKAVLELIQQWRQAHAG